MTKKLRSEPSKPRPSSKLTELPSAAAHREAAQYDAGGGGRRTLRGKAIHKAEA